MGRPKKQREPKNGTKARLKSVYGCPCLYREPDNPRASYYGRTRKDGHDLLHKLDTVDKDIAKRKLAQWLDSLDKPQDDKTGKADIPFGELIARFLKYRTTCKPGTQGSERGIASTLRKTFDLLDAPLSEITTADINLWVGQIGRRWNDWREEKACRKRIERQPQEDDDAWKERLKELLLWKPRTQIKYRLFMKQMFDFAIFKKLLTVNPFISEKIDIKEKDSVKRPIPSQTTFEQIIASVRGQQRIAGGDAQESADFLEFQGLVGVGQAEAAALTWEDVDLGSENGRLCFRRVKTGALFNLPFFFPEVRELLERRRKNANGATHVFSIDNARHALANACKRLKIRHYSQRNLRAMRITNLLDAGVDVKQIASWQGHKDGGKLIWDTYTEVLRERGEIDRREREALEKINAFRAGSHGA